jgi:hypothetical protein
VLHERFHKFAAPKLTSGLATFRIRGFGGLSATAGLEEQPRRVRRSRDWTCPTAVALSSSQGIDVVALLRCKR